MRMTALAALRGVVAAPLRGQTPGDSMGLDPGSSPRIVTATAGPGYGAGWSLALARGDGRTAFYLRSGFMF